LENIYNIEPYQGLRGLYVHFKDDFTAAISVSLVALPISLGIAVASGAPPISGIISALVGGIVCTFLRGSHVSINGPAIGLTIVILYGSEALGGYRFVLAAIVCAGLLQMALGLFKLDRLAYFFPSSVIYGMLAAIGVTMIARLSHEFFGINSEPYSAIEELLLVPHRFKDLNPFITGISIISIFILAMRPFFQQKIIQKIPRPLLVLVFSLLAVKLTNEIYGHFPSILPSKYYIDSSYLIYIPDGIRESLIYPDFSKIDYPAFWFTVISITLLGSIETLTKTMAADKLDLYKRKSNLNKELFAVGSGTLLSGMIGGLPIITAIDRSTININHGAKTKWSNFYHSILLCLIILFFPSIVKEIPRSCLAAILIYFGYKLASPKIFKDALMKGWEQLAVLATTMIATLYSSLLIGLLLGILENLLIHQLQTQLDFKTFFSHLKKTRIETETIKNQIARIELSGIVNFLYIPKLIKTLQQSLSSNHVVMDFSKTTLTDTSALEVVHEYIERHEKPDRRFELLGLDLHKTSSEHPYSLHILRNTKHPNLIGRQTNIFQFSLENDCKYYPDIDWNIHYFKDFTLFRFHLIEYQNNVIKGAYYNGDINWHISDLYLDEGALQEAEVFRMTVLIIFPDFELPDFVIRKESILESIQEVHRHKNYGFSDFKKDLIKKYMLKSNDPEGIKSLFSDNLIDFLINYQGAYNIECKNNKILLFKRKKLASLHEIKEMVGFGMNFIRIVSPKLEKLT